MENEMLMDDAPRNDKADYKSWELSGDEALNEPDTETIAGERSNKSSPSQSKPVNKNSAAKAASKAASAVSNTNPNVRTGLSDTLNNTGTNVAYTERED